MTCPKCHQGYNVAGWRYGKTVLCPSCKVPLTPAGSLAGVGAVATPTKSMPNRTAPQAAVPKPDSLALFSPEGQAVAPPEPEIPIKKVELPPTVPAQAGPKADDSLAFLAPGGDDLVPSMPSLKQPPATDLKKLIPDEFAGYRILKEVARGGMGVVLLADQPSLRRRVAMKLMLPSAESDDPASRERFLREARAMAKLKHPYIIQVYDIGEIQGMPWFTMEYIDGSTLGDLIDDKRLDVNHAVDIHHKVAQALAFSHSQGILHRDLKPGNIMVRKGGDPVLMDFGLAKDVTGESVKLSITGTVIGTPAYMSPEQAKAQRLDARADVYSLGAVLYEAVTGQVPFEGKTAYATIYQVINDIPKPARSLNPAVPPDLSRICAKAMEKDPIDRYPTMNDLALDLEKYIQGEVIAAQGPSLEYRIRQWVKSHKTHCVAGVSVAAVLMVVLLLMGSGFLRATTQPEVDYMKTLAEGSPTTRVARIQALAGDIRDGKIEKNSSDYRKACKAFEVQTSDGSGKVAVASIEALAELAPQTHIDIYAAQTNRARPLEVRRAAVDALAMHKPQGVSMVLSRVAETDPDTDLRIRAIRGMPSNAETSAMMTLIRVASRGMPRSVAEAAREKLKELRSPDSVLSMYAGSRTVEHARALGDMLEKTGDYERQLEAAMGMINENPQGKKKRASQPYEVAIRRLKDGDAEQRMTAAFDLGVMKRQESEEALREALADEDSDVALAAADALGKIPKLLEPEKIADFLNVEVHERPSVRMAAARACGLVNPPPPTDPLVAALSKERDTGVQVELAQALGRLRPPEAKLPLLALLVEGAMPAKIRAVWAMGQLGDKTVCPALVNALEKARPADKELKTELAGALSALTGKSHGTDVAKWRRTLKMK